MKRVIIVFALLGMFAVQGVGQGVKLAYASPNYILANMPESKQIEAELETYGKQLENQLQSKIQEFEQKYQSYEAGKTTMTELVRADKEKELQTLQQSIQEFQKNAQSDIQRKETQLLAPVVDKVNNAIKQIAKEKAYTYIFSSDAGMGASFILHAPEGDDISDLVLGKLGITKN
jgi:outer membrane protein